MTTIYLVRHGETQVNAEDRINGDEDVGLTKRGEEQAKKCGERLATILNGRDALLVSSPSLRAVQTALRIYPASRIYPALRTRTDPRLVELGKGVFSGTTMQTHPEIYNQYQQLQAEFKEKYPTAEQRAEHIDELEDHLEREFGLEPSKKYNVRLRGALDDVLAKVVAKNLDAGIVVTHSGTIRAILAMITGVPPTDQPYDVPNASVTTLEYFPPRTIYSSEGTLCRACGNEYSRQTKKWAVKQLPVAYAD